MATQNINRVIVTGNLTHDPELRQTSGGTAVAEIRMAVNSRRKDGSGEWVDKPNYITVKAFGRQAENAAQYLAKGRPVAVDGRLEWSQWQAQDGSKRQTLEVIADAIQFLGSREDDGQQARPAASQDDIPF